jgi:hypothetical protein
MRHRQGDSEVTFAAVNAAIRDDCHSGCVEEMNVFGIEIRVLE